MDVGFGAVLEKFEEYFGKGVTRAFLILVGLAISAVCVGAIWQWLVGPLLGFLDSPQRWRTITRLSIIAFGLGAGVGIGMFLINGLSRWIDIKFSVRRIAQLVRMTDEANELLDRTEERLQYAELAVQRAEAIAEAGMLLVSELKKKDGPNDQQK
jgi:hypothetical protein